MKVKIIENGYKDLFEQDFNNFIKNKKVIDIKFQDLKVGVEALIMYEED